MERRFSQGERLAISAALIFASYLVLHIVFGRHELPAYDAYTYISFARHYAENWFYTVIPGQAHGLQIVSYPPLLFQVMALLSFVPGLDMIAIYILLISAGMTGLSYVFYSFISDIMSFEIGEKQEIFVLIAFSAGLLKFALVHGQLTFIVGMVFGTLSAKYFYQGIKGEMRSARLAASLLLTAYIHHFSLLMTGLMIVVLGLLNFRQTVDRLDSLIPPVLFSGTIAVIGLFPVITETLFGISQGIIFHGSRQPLQEAKIFHQFITTTYGLSVLGILLSLKRDKVMRTANIMALMFLTLGLGLITPTPEILFGDMSTFLVYDRFSLIASLFLTGIIGYYISELSWHPRGIDMSKVAVAVMIVVSLATVFWANSLHLGDYTGYGVYDENRTEATIEFLNNNASDDYLYTTYDHFPPIGQVRQNTDVPTLDTGYYQGRKHGLLEGEGKFDRVTPEKFKTVIKNADNLSLKYVFVYDARYNFMFSSTSWEKKQLVDHLRVWINPDAEPYEPDLGERRLLFGTVPIAVLLLSTAIFASKRFRERMEEYFAKTSALVESVLRERSVRSFALVALLPVLAALPSFLTSGYPAGIDTPAHIFKPQLMAQMVQNYGSVFRWTSQWYNGYPFLSMYPPLSTWAIFYLERLTGDITLAYNTVRFSSIFSISAVMYLLAGKVSERKGIRLLAAAMAVFSYPLYSNLYTVGRLASALALPLYLLMIYLLLRDDIFQKEVSRGHIYLALNATLLFLVHAMTAYMFVFTGLIFCWVYRDRLREIGLKPAITVFSIPVVLCFPYLARLLQHFSTTNPFWYIHSIELDLFRHIARNFELTVPNYFGWVQAAFLVLGLKETDIMEDRFMKFSVLNFLFFYITFWARNFRIAYHLPLSRQFDLARFEIIFTVFGILIAVYGAKYLFENYLSGIKNWKKSLFGVAVVLFMILSSSPMLVQSANWQPHFQDELEDIQLNDNYRGIGVDMRKWHTYILWEMNISNTFGWFNQANPNSNFTEDLQSAGGRWYGEPLVYENDPDYRKNLLELSNTRYIVNAKGEWMNPALKMQVKGADDLTHPHNQKLLEEIALDDEFNRTYNSKHLSIYTLERDMSYCEGVEPIWISENYRERSKEMLKEGRMLPDIPVKGSSEGRRQGVAANVTCSRSDPYNIRVDVRDEGWVLVKESIYPFWERKDGGSIHDGYGFMVVYVENSTELVYRPRDISTLGFEDIISLTG